MHIKKSGWLLQLLQNSSAFCYEETMSYYITIFDRQIPLYGICFYAGIFLAATLAMLLSQKRGLPRYEITYSAVYTMTGSLIGSKLLFILVSIKDIIRYSIPILAVIKGGFVFYGGLIGGLLGLLIYTKQFKLSIVPFLDVYATVLPLGHAIGRVGCFFGGCCYGMEYDGVGHIIYHESVGNTPLGVPLLPIQLIEAFCLLLLFLVLLILLLRGARLGIPTTCYALSSSVLRFILEFFRGDTERGRFGMLSTSQWVSLAVFLAAVGLLLLRLSRRKKKK